MENRPNLPYNFSFKNPKELDSLLTMSPYLLQGFTDILIYCWHRNLPVVITRAVAWEIPGVSKSSTHSEGRAIDISVRGWSADQIDAFVKHFNDKYGESIGAISATTGKGTFVVFHNALDKNGTAYGWHFHVQVRRITK
jgi:N-acyl-D-aspartate/D-glutamate deacylase